MTPASKLIADDIQGYLEAHEHKGLLLFITCGSVNDGKSTLIDRLFPEDQLAAIKAASRKLDIQGDELGFPPSVGGLEARRKQDIDTDVACRFFRTDRREFIVANPGHEQHIHYMFSSGSTAEMAILMVDARQGALTQTRYHSLLISLLGIRHVVVAINKMDLVNYSKARFDQIVEEYRAFAKRLGLENITFIPVSALKGDNVAKHSVNMPWYHGTTLMDYLETVEVDDARRQRAPFRLPVQWVNHPNEDLHSFVGMVAGGRIRPGDTVRVLPSGQASRVTRIYTCDGDLDEAVAGQSVMLQLDDKIDISRGDVICGTEEPAQVADQFEASLVWMDEQPLLPGRPYLIKLGTQTASLTVTDIKYQVNVNSLEHVAARQLDLNAIGVCNLSLDRPVAFDPFRDNPDTGGFTLIDRMTQHAVGIGMLSFALRRSQNLHPQHVDIDKQARAAAKSQNPAVLWFTGLSGAGKSTIANLVEKKLHAAGQHTYLLDGDNVRHGLNRDLGFTDADRVENIRRVAEVAKLMADAGLIVLTAFISPFRSERQLARELMEEGEFVEVHIDVPLEVAESRDPKGLYRKARRGELKNFTGIDSAYEAPESPELRLDTSMLSEDDAAEAVIQLLRENGRITG